MAESSQQKRGRSMRSVASITLVLAGCLATAALAATVTQAPTISGDLSTGSDLSATSGAWTPAGATATYDWLRCNASGGACEGITGACGRTYKVRKADEGHSLRVRLTATESNGDAAAAESAPTAAIAAKPYTLPSDSDPDTCIKVTPTGPGEGTFSSGTQTGAGSEPDPESTLHFIDPFPVIRISGPLQGQAHDAHARHRQRAAGRAHPDHLHSQGSRLSRTSARPPP